MDFAMLTYLLGARCLAAAGTCSSCVSRRVDSIVCDWTPHVLREFRQESRDGGFFSPEGGIASQTDNLRRTTRTAWRKESRSGSSATDKAASCIKLADGKVRQQKTIELLPHQFRSLAAQHDLTSAEMGLQFVKRVFDLPSLVIESGQFGRRFERIQDRRDQPVDRFGVGDAVQLIVNNTNSYPLRFVSRILFRRIDSAEIRTIAQSFEYL